MSIQSNFNLPPNATAQIRGMSWGAMNFGAKQVMNAANEDTAAVTVESGLPTQATPTPGIDPLSQSQIAAADHAGKLSIEGFANTIGGAITMAGGSTSFNLSGGARDNATSPSPIGVSYDSDHFHVVAAATSVAKTANDIGTVDTHLSSLITQHTDMGPVSPTGQDGLVGAVNVAGPIRTPSSMQMAA